MGAEEVGVVRCEFHPGFKPMTIQSIVAAKTGDVFQTLEHACMPWRELVGHTKRTFSPVVSLEMARSQTQSMRSVAVHVQRRNGQLAMFENGEQTSEQACVVDGKMVRNAAFNRLVLNHRP